jgi:hypothetical protein
MEATARRLCIDLTITCTATQEIIIGSVAFLHIIVCNLSVVDVINLEWRLFLSVSSVLNGIIPTSLAKRVS